MEYTLDQRRYRLNLSKKQLHDECNGRGRKISYASVCKVVDHPGETLFSNEKKVIDTIVEMEKERGITDVQFD